MLKVNDVSRIYLGVQGEDCAQTITIDVRDWLVDFPDGSVTIWHKRNGDSVPSATGAVFDSEAGTISWTPTSTDTYVSGEGEAEIRLTSTGVIKKSRAVKTGVSPAVTLSGTPLGSDWQSYINAVDALRAAAVSAKNAAVEAAEDAEAVAVNVPYINLSNNHWMIYDTDQDQYVDSGISAAGVPGPQGIQGVQGPQGPQGIPGQAGAKGERGDPGQTGPKGDTGEKGDKGDTGSAFEWKKSYASIADMEADFHGTDVLLGEYVLIASGLGTADNNKIYQKGSLAWIYVTQMTGAKGAKGDKGDKGDPGDRGATGSPGEKGDTGETGPQGPQGIQGIQGEPGEGVPTGGTADQVLSKVSGTDYDTHWETLGDAARQAVQNDLTRTTEGAVLDARQGKELQDEVAALNLLTLKKDVASQIIVDPTWLGATVLIIKSGATNGALALFQADADGGNFIAQKGNSTIELDSQGLNDSGTGYGRVVTTIDGGSEKVFQFKQSGDFVNGNGVSLDDLNNKITRSLVINNPTAFSVSNNVETELASINITSGKWLIVCACGWSSNANGFRWLGTGNQRDRKSTMNAVNGEMTQQELVYLYETSNNETVTLSGYQNSGSSLTVYPIIKAYKLL